MNNHERTPRPPPAPLSATSTQSHQIQLLLPLLLPLSSNFRENKHSVFRPAAAV